MKMTPWFEPRWASLGAWIFYNRVKWPSRLKLLLEKGTAFKISYMGRGGGIEVSILAFYSHNLSSNPAGY